MNEPPFEPGTMIESSWGDLYYVVKYMGKNRRGFHNYIARPLTGGKTVMLYCPVEEVPVPIKLLCEFELHHTYLDGTAFSCMCTACGVIFRKPDNCAGHWNDGL